MKDVKILLVDDEGDIRQMLRMLMHDRAWTVEEATSGEEAIERCSRGLPDLIVLDHKMAGLSGLEVARRLREEGARCPIILYSAYLSPDLEASAKELDLVPVSKTDLMGLVDMLRELGIAEARE